MTDTALPSIAALNQPGLRARIAALQPGESLAEATRLMIGPTNEREIGEEVEKLRNRINPQIARAKNSTGHVYTVENGSFLTRSRDLILAFVVTRVE